MSLELGVWSRESKTTFYAREFDEEKLAADERGLARIRTEKRECTRTMLRLPKK
jgi:hypothetical protein